MTVELFVHWVSALFLVTMASLALVEAKSSSLIPKSLFLWPLTGFLFGLFTFISLLIIKGRDCNQLAVATLGFVVLLSSAQALLVNIRKISPWPSGAIWLGFILVGVFYQIPCSGGEEVLFRSFVSHLSGFLWVAIGITKVIGEKTVSQGTGIPVWIVLMYIQAILTASLSY